MSFHFPTKNSQILLDFRPNPGEPSLKKSPRRKFRDFKQLTRVHRRDSPTSTLLYPLKVILIFIPIIFYLGNNDGIEFNSVKRCITEWKNSIPVIFLCTTNERRTRQCEKMSEKMRQWVRKKLNVRNEEEKERESENQESSVEPGKH